MNWIGQLEADSDYTAFMNHDLSKPQDLEVLLQHFYEHVLKDPIIGYLFTDVAQLNLNHHLPVVVSFWSDQLFGTSDYDGELFKAHADVHAQAGLRPGHFTRWLYLLDRAIAECEFSGPNTQRLVELAERIAKSMSAALNSQKRSATALSLKDLL